MSGNRGPEVSGVSGLFLALTWIFTILRIYSRFFVAKSFGFDDYLAILAQLLFTLFCMFAIAAVEHGMGQHTWNIQNPENIPIALKWWWACEVAYVLSNVAIKFSICVFLLRIVVSKTQKRILWTVMAISGVICTYFLFLFIFQCRPVAYFWTQYSGMQGACLNPSVITISTYIYSAVRCCSDWTCCILPVYLVWNLQMNARTKISVYFILALGTIASIATIIRIPYINGLLDASDFLYTSTDIAVWSLSETGLSIIAAAAITLRPLFRTFFALHRSAQEASHMWPSSRMMHLSSQNNTERYRDKGAGLARDVWEDVGLKTVIHGPYTDPHSSGRSRVLKDINSVQPYGIRKTVVISSQTVLG